MPSGGIWIRLTSAMSFAAALGIFAGTLPPSPAHLHALRVMPATITALLADFLARLC
jgi:hypothetical protein